MLLTFIGRAQIDRHPGAVAGVHIIELLGGVVTVARSKLRIRAIAKIPRTGIHVDDTTEIGTGRERGFELVARHLYLAGLIAFQSHAFDGAVNLAHIGRDVLIKIIIVAAALVFTFHVLVGIPRTGKSEHVGGCLHEFVRRIETHGVVKDLTPLLSLLQSQQTPFGVSTIERIIVIRNPAHLVVLTIDIGVEADPPHHVVLAVRIISRILKLNVGLVERKRGVRPYELALHLVPGKVGKAWQREATKQQ